MAVTPFHLCSVWKPVLMTERRGKSDSILLSRCFKSVCKRGWERQPLPYLDDDWWQTTFTQKYSHFAPERGVCCMWATTPRVVLLRCHDDYVEALFSPFPYWWWRRCLLWPPVWWCTLHLHNVSVRREDQRRDVLRHTVIISSPFSLWEWDLSHDRTQYTLRRKWCWVGLQGDTLQLDDFLCQ